MTKKTTKKPKEPKRWLDDPNNVKKLIRGFYWTCAVIILIDLVYSIGWHKHAAFSDESLIEGPETWPAFYGIYGFVACSVLVFIAKALRSYEGKPLLMRDEDYWEK
jgi:hypothetical protein